MSPLYGPLSPMSAPASTSRSRTCFQRSLESTAMPKLAIRAAASLRLRSPRCRRRPEHFERRSAAQSRIYILVGRSSPPSGTPFAPNTVPRSRRSGEIVVSVAHVVDSGGDRHVWSSWRCRTRHTDTTMRSCPSTAGGRRVRCPTAHDVIASPGSGRQGARCRIQRSANTSRRRGVLRVHLRVARTTSMHPARIRALQVSRPRSARDRRLGPRPATNDGGSTDVAGDELRSRSSAARLAAVPP